MRYSSSARHRRRAAPHRRRKTLTARDAHDLHAPSHANRSASRGDCAFVFCFSVLPDSRLTRCPGTDSRSLRVRQRAFSRSSLLKSFPFHSLKRAEYERVLDFDRQLTAIEEDAIPPYYKIGSSSDPGHIIKSLSLKVAFLSFVLFALLPLSSPSSSSPLTAILSGANPHRANAPPPSFPLPLLPRPQIHPLPSNLPRRSEANSRLPSRAGDGGGVGVHVVRDDRGKYGVAC
jgi:hypothetical protein